MFSEKKILAIFFVFCDECSNFAEIKPHENSRYTVIWVLILLFIVKGKPYVEVEF